MPSIQPTLFNDLINSFWTVVIFVVLFCWLPTITSIGLKTKITSELSNQNKESTVNVTEQVGYCLRITLGLILVITSLSYLHLLNWLTLSLLYVILLFFGYLENHDWQLKSELKNIQDQIFKLIDIFDRGLSLEYLFKDIYQVARKKVGQFSNYLDSLMINKGTIYVVVLIVILAFALLLRWEYPLSQLRFSHPDSYSNLLIARQIVTGKYPEINYLPSFSALAATISLLGSIDAMQTIRFLSPILGIVMVLSVGYFVSVFSKNSFSTLVAMLALGIYLFTWEQIPNSQLPIWLSNIINSLNNSLVRQWTGDELEIGTISLLLGLGYLFDSDQREGITFKINVACSLILVAISAPSLLILTAIAPIGLLGGRKLLSVGITSAWIILAVFAASTEKLIWTQSFLLTLPVALSLLAALLFSGIIAVVKMRSQRWVQSCCLGLAIALSGNFLLPLTPQLTYLEYDIAARKTLEIKSLFSRNSWSLAAPTEQLAEIYGSGWYEDLALFVEQYADKVANPEFKFPISGTDLFVLVEKIPFVTFPNEPISLPNSILSDRTYRYYRSTAGRASLEFEALQMCTTYFQNHSDSQIYFENAELRIYQFKANLDSRLSLNPVNSSVGESRYDLGIKRSLKKRLLFYVRN